MTGHKLDVHIHSKLERPLSAGYFPHISSLNQYFSPACAQNKDFPESRTWQWLNPPLLKCKLFLNQCDISIVLPVSEDAVILTVNARHRKSSISCQNDHPSCQEGILRDRAKLIARKQTHQQQSADKTPPPPSSSASLPLLHLMHLTRTRYLPAFLCLMGDSFITDGVCSLKWEAVATRRHAQNRDKETATATQRMPNMFQSDTRSLERMHCQKITAHMLIWCWEHQVCSRACAQAGQMNVLLLEWLKRSSALRQRQAPYRNPCPLQWSVIASHPTKAALC